jgi:hypothetical protein
MRGSRIVLAATSFLYASGASAADIDLTELRKVEYTSMSPTWSVVGSLSPTYTANALFSRDDRRGIFTMSPM